MKKKHLIIRIALLVLAGIIFQSCCTPKAYILDTNGTFRFLSKKKIDSNVVIIEGVILSDEDRQPLKTYISYDDEPFITSKEGYFKIETSINKQSFSFFTPYHFTCNIQFKAKEGEHWFVEILLKHDPFINTIIDPPLVREKDIPLVREKDN